MAKLDEDSLKALLSAEIRSAIAYDDSELSSRRARAMEYYRGEMNDTPSMSGRSSVTSRDIADTIGWMLPGIIRVFTASDQMAIAEPVKPSDEDVAEQATDYLNHIFWKDNPGYRVLWDATHDSLLQGNGIVSLHQGVKRFVKEDRLIPFETIGKILTCQELLYCEILSQANQVDQR